MKKLIQWLAKVFNAEITVEKTVEKEKIVEVPVKEYVDVPVCLGGVVDGDVTVKGDLVVNGKLSVNGVVACLRKEA